MFTFVPIIFFIIFTIYSYNQLKLKKQKELITLKTF